MARCRWRHYAQLNWQLAPWRATIAQTFQSGYVDENFYTNLPPRRVGTYDIWDLQGVYTALGNWTLALGIRNLLNTDPPSTNQIETAQAGYDPQYADLRRHTFNARLTYTFK